DGWMRQEAGWRSGVCTDPCAVLFFFFQAGDGIRDKLVTGVQTCALPILVPGHRAAGLTLKRQNETWSRRFEKSVLPTFRSPSPRAPEIRVFLATDDALALGPTPSPPKFAKEQTSIAVQFCNLLMLFRRRQ